MRYCLLLPVLARNSEGNLRVSDSLFLLFVAMTVATAAAGYIINDVIDEPIDRINKPEKLFVGVFFSRQQALLFYAIVMLFGLVCSLVLSICTAFFWWTVCYVAANIVLFAYSKYLKKMPFIGNFTVAIFTACVAWGVAMPIMQPPYSIAQSHILYVFINYCGFAFFSNLIREIIKDLEDMEGDSYYDCHTLPLVWGVQKTKILVFTLTFFLLFALFLFTKYLIINALYWGLIWLVATVVFPFLMSISLLYAASEKSDFALISRIFKLIMVGGLVFLLL
jgi:4-hydroxybenzoate polyprenyltransferase